MLILPAAALAVQAAPVSPSAADAVEACRAIAGDAPRLACFDQAAAAFAKARERKELVVMDRTEVRRAKRGLFGFSLPSIKLFGGDEDDAVKQIDSVIAATAPYGYGYYRVTLDDGSQWETIDRNNAFDPRRGDKITIRYGAFGYRATSLGGTVAIRRIK